MNNLLFSGLNRLYRILLLLTVSLLMVLCKPEADQLANDPGLLLRFSHKVNGDSLITRQMIYLNEANNPYQVDEVKYFISEIRLHYSGGSIFELQNQGRDIHYIDIDYPLTLLWDNTIAVIPAGQMDSLTFTFGLSKEKNQSYIFPNPPENAMYWPEILGGGYHYMMMNGKWIDIAGNQKPMNFHLGTGQEYASGVLHHDSITGYIDNSFRVALHTDIEFLPNLLYALELTMNIEEWFKTPHIYDHNDYGGHIMQNQQAMKKACENGRSAFSIQLMEQKPSELLK